MKAEIKVVKNCLNKDNNDLSIANLKTTVKNKIFPNMYKLLQVALTLLLSSVTCELSFSAMQKIKT
jgi:hypothetical protein